MVTVAIDLAMPEDFNWAYDVIDRWADDPQKLGMHWVGPTGEERQITFAEFRARSHRLANGLEAMGLQRGDRVLLMLPRVVAWWECILGLMKMGGVPMPATILLTPKDSIYRINIAEARAVITDADGATKIQAIRDQCPTLQHLIVVGSPVEGTLGFEDLISAGAPERARMPTPGTDPALIYFTSGTVGNAKMVLHTHASYPIGHRITGKYWLDLTPDDLHWNLSDTGWAKAAWSSLFGPWNMGTALFIHDGRGKYNPHETLELLQRYPITSFCAAPTIYRLLVQEDLKAFTFSTLRSCVSAGEPLNPEVIEVWREATGLTVRDGYGQTESVLLCGNPPGQPIRPGSMGKPLPGIDLAIIDDENEPLPPGKEGDLAVRVRPERPVGLFKEYWRNPNGTVACHRGDWYVTGDRAYVDEDGYYWFVGRSDDVIISAGYRIGPFEVESALIEHPAVAEAAVVAKPDAARGAIVKAYVVLVSSAQPSEELQHELQEFVKTNTAPYKYPREIEFVRDLPKTISGKIRRIELRARAEQESQ
ncbi:acyl-CoA synthetase [Candidatus Chloroploca sp. Khr17]|uniref:acyl-CoA synthetase n=1 Tax=Candidatus Chloroploca sp. Khr17 TaxID=2496869 RepID=UPI00196A4940|nr:AMP-binding protein [Candidatus Chloroploca sp. Khr17]